MSVMSVMSTKTNWIHNKQIAVCIIRESTVIGNSTSTNIFWTYHSFTELQITDHSIVTECMLLIEVIELRIQLTEVTELTMQFTTFIYAIEYQQDFFKKF